MQPFIDWVLGFVSQMDYITIFILMTIESSIIPFPSEVVMIPAGISSANGNINPILATIIWGLGSLLGAIFNYYIVGKWLGKPFLWKFGKYFFIKHSDYERAEKLFQENANWYTFIGRLIPVIRQLISVPAGIFGMKLKPFLGLTFLGATLWCAVLVILGYYLGNPALELVKNYSHEVALVVIPLIAIYLWWKIWWSKQKKNA
jgi:membrane protein DedA with SNARE-associated domain